MVAPVVYFTGDSRAHTRKVDPRRRVCNNCMNPRGKYPNNSCILLSHLFNEHFKSDAKLSIQFHLNKKGLA